jgi:3-oxoacyl-[acyl-carrier-protein] synthase-1
LSKQTLAIADVGMVTGVGLSAPAACAAIRCAIDGFAETRFRDSGGEWLIGCEVPLERPLRGAAKLAGMLAIAIDECTRGDPMRDIRSIPVVLCTAEPERPGGAAGDEDRLIERLQSELGLHLHEASLRLADGRVGVALALSHAQRLIYRDGARQVIVAAADSLLRSRILADFEARDRLLTSRHSDGFIPGEAAAAILFEAPREGARHQWICDGIGFGAERASEDSEEPLRADGLVAAIRAALAEAGCEMGDVDFRIADVSGSQYRFKEAALAVSRTLRRRKNDFDFWHPADCVGETGAAAGAVMLGVLEMAGRKGYAKGRRVLLHLGNEDGRRAAMVFSASISNQSSTW